MTDPTSVSLTVSGQTDKPEVRRYEGQKATGWQNWIMFTGAMFAMLGSFHVIQGLVALLNDDYYLVDKTGLAANASLTAWGWTQIVVGVVVVAAGAGLFTGKTWARIAGVVIAMISAIVNLSFLAAYPEWSTIMIAVDVLIIYALTVHGRELSAG